MMGFLRLQPWRKAGVATVVCAAVALLAPAAALALPDGRGWELVSPIEKNGSSIAAPKGIANGGVLQAALDGNSVTYGSTVSFGPGAGGAPPAGGTVAGPPQT
jgi:hypothetical protein